MPSPKRRPPSGTRCGRRWSGCTCRGATTATCRTSPDGGFWQFQRHIYLNPFYYIDYTLAQTCALQLWVRSQKDPGGTLAAYNALCRRGGEAPFQELARSAGLVSPFQKGCLRDVVEQAKMALA